MNPSLDNSFGSFGSSGSNFGMSVSGPISSGTGEVALPTTEKKSKKWLVVVVAFLFVVALVVGLISLATSNQTTGPALNAKSYQEAFNLYANYYLYGEASKDEIIAEYDEKQESYLDKLIDKDEVPSDYLDNLIKYYETFLDLYEKSSIKDDDTLATFEKYGNELDLMVAYLRDDFIARSDIMDAYLSGGEVAANNLIETKLQSYKNLGKIDNLSFYDYAFGWAEKILELAEAYDNLGCVSNGNLSYSCIYKEDSEDVEKVSDEAAKDYYYVLKLLNDSRDNLYGQIFEINKLMREGR